MQVFVWAICGLAAGWLTARLTLSMGRDKLINLLLGVTGGAAGGFLVDATFFSMKGRMIYTSLAAILAAVLLILASRYLSVCRDRAQTLSNSIFFLRRARARAVTGK